MPPYYHSGAKLLHIKSIALRVWELCIDKVKAILQKMRAMLLQIFIIIDEKLN